MTIAQSFAVAGQRMVVVSFRQFFIGCKHRDYVVRQRNIVPALNKELALFLNSAV